MGTDIPSNISQEGDGAGALVGKMVRGGGCSLLLATVCLDICKVGIGRDGEKVKVLGIKKAATLGHRISGQYDETVSGEMNAVSLVPCLWPWATAWHCCRLGLCWTNKLEEDRSAGGDSIRGVQNLSRTRMELWTSVVQTVREGSLWFRATEEEPYVPC